MKVEENGRLAILREGRRPWSLPSRLRAFMAVRLYTTGLPWLTDHRHKRRPAHHRPPQITNKASQAATRRDRHSWTVRYTPLSLESSRISGFSAATSACLTETDTRMNTAERIALWAVPVVKVQRRTAEVDGRSARGTSTNKREWSYTRWS